MEEDTQLWDEQGTSHIKDIYLELIENCCGLENDVLLAVLNKCIKQIKNGCAESDNQSTEIRLQIAALSKLLTKKIYETECDTYEIKVPVVNVECEPSVNCRFCDEIIEQTKLAEHQKQNCKSLTLGELTPAKPCSEYLYRIRVADIECVLCGILCKTIAVKISHDDSFGHLTRSNVISRSILDTIYCSLCCESLPNNNVQCYEHIQCASHRRLQDPIVNWYQMLVRYHSLLSFVRCITCNENLYSGKEVNEHHFTKHDKTKRQKSVCRVWCIFCDRCDDKNDLPLHFMKCNQLSAFYCQLCNETIRGSSAFVLHVKSCLGVSTLDELNINSEFSNLLVSGKTTAQPIGDKNTKSTKPSSPLVIPDTTATNLSISGNPLAQTIKCRNTSDIKSGVPSVSPATINEENSAHNVVVERDRKNISTFFCFCCKQTMHGNAGFALIAKKCRGVKSLIEVNSLKEFSNSLSERNPVKQPPSNNKEIGPFYPKQPTAGPFSAKRIWCNCCADFCQDLRQHYQQSCKPVITNVLFTLKGPNIQSLFDITVNGITCNYCNIHFTNLKLFRQHENMMHSEKNNALDHYSAAFIYCSVCSDYIPDDGMFYEHHILSSDHKQLNRKKGWLNGYSYILLFFVNRCLLCQMNLFSINELICHHKRNHASEGDAAAWCQSCDTSVYLVDIKKHNGLDSHKEWNLREMVCLLCHGRYTGYYNLLCHVQYCCETTNEDHLDCSSTSSLLSYQSEQIPLLSKVENPAPKKRPRVTHGKKSTESFTSVKQKSLADFSNLNYATASSSQNSVILQPGVNFSVSSSTPKASQSSPVCSSGVNYVLAPPNSQTSGFKSLSAQPSTKNSPTVNNATPATKSNYNAKIVNYTSTASNSKSSVAPAPTAKSSSVNYSSASLNNPAGSSSSTNSVAVNSSSVNNPTQSVSASSAGQAPVVNSPSVSYAATSSRSKSSALPTPTATSLNLSHVTPVTGSNLNVSQTPASELDDNIVDWFTRYPYQSTANATKTSQATRNSPQRHSNTNNWHLPRNRSPSPTNYSAPLQPRTANPWASSPPVAPPAPKPSSKCLVM